MDQQAVPKWLPGFLAPANKGHIHHYFAECKEHIHHNAKSRAADQNTTKKGDKNYYCVDCVRGPLCETGFKVDHGGHKVLQVRKASHTDAIRINDISRLVDIDYIQTYTINGAKIVFLPSRPQTKPAKGSPSYCDECRRSLQDQAVRFCSLSCKMIAIQGRPKDDLLSLTGGVHSGEEQSAMSGDAGSDLLRPASPSPAVPAKKRARSSSKKEFAPATLIVPPHMVFDKLHRANVSSPTSVLLSHPDHHTDVPELSSAVSGGCESSSSQDSLETRFMGFRKRSRKGEPNRAFGVGIIAPEGIYV